MGGDGGTRRQSVLQPGVAECFVQVKDVDSC